jgi:phosphoribosylformylglycinamidine cyclo-ligase
MSQSKYAQMGVDAGKASVRSTFGKYINNDFPGAFVNIIRSVLHPGYVKTLHLDGDGSKFIERLLMFVITDDASYLRYAVDDGLQMNLGDIAASGFVRGHIMVGDVINLCTKGTGLQKEVIMEQLANRFAELIELHRQYGFSISFLGGETADLPDQVLSVVFDVAVEAEMNERYVVKGNVQEGDAIYGFQSDGRAVWEEVENSGVMANGQTLGRTSLMAPEYNDLYPFLHGTNPFTGRFAVDAQPDILAGMTVADALLSPTRQWSIVIKMLIDALEERNALDLLHGISMNTGGGATKIGHVGKGILYKKQMPEPPAVFQLIHQESGEKWEDMFEGFNCGIGIDVVGDDHPLFHEAIVEASEKSAVASQLIGVCHSFSGNGNKVELKTPYGNFDY